MSDHVIQIHTNTGSPADVVDAIRKWEQKKRDVIQEALGWATSFPDDGFDDRPLFHLTDGQRSTLAKAARNHQQPMTWRRWWGLRPRT